MTDTLEVDVLPEVVVLQLPSVTLGCSTCGQPYQGLDADRILETVPLFCPRCGATVHARGLLSGCYIFYEYELPYGVYWHPGRSVDLVTADVEAQPGARHGYRFVMRKVRQAGFLTKQWWWTSRLGQERNCGTAELPSCQPPLLLSPAPAPTVRCQPELYAFIDDEWDLADARDAIADDLDEREMAWREGDAEGLVNFLEALDNADSWMRCQGYTTKQRALDRPRGFRGLTIDVVTQFRDMTSADRPREDEDDGW